MTTNLESRLLCDHCHGHGYEDTAAGKVACGECNPPAPRQLVKLGVVEFHPNQPLQDDFYMVVDDLRAAGCIVDLWLLDISTVLRRHGYEMEVYRRQDQSEVISNHQEMSGEQQ
jgi:hypothetical protein